MLKTKLFITTILSLVLMSLTCIAFATNTVGNDIKNGVTDIGNGIKDTAGAVGNGVKNVATDIGNGVRDTATDIGNGVNNGTNNVRNGTNTLANDVNNGINNNRMNTPNTAGTYNTTRVATNPGADTINFLGMQMSRTAVVLTIVALAAIITAILIFSYVSQNNDKYRDEERY